MVTRQELKQRAKAQLGGSIFHSRWITALLVCFLSTMIMSALNMPGAVINGIQNIRMFSEGGSAGAFQLSVAIAPFGMVAMLVLSGPLNYGRSRMFLKQVRDGENMVIGDLFKGFYEDFGGNIVLSLAIALFTFLWSLLFIVPGIVKGYAYAMSFYIKADHPDYDWKTCINESKRIMQGHKGELFVIDLSFVGWMVVGALCLGIGTLWVAPYVEATKTHFYQNLLIADAAGQAPPPYAEPDDFRPEI